jgi:DNA primase
MITAFEAGFENVVAPLGTAFTDFHARMLKRHAEEIVLCFDSDTAGYKAAERAFSILAPSGLIVKVAPLPQGEDPDSLIRKQGPEVFRHQLEQARDFFDHMIDFATGSRNLTDTREKTRFVDEVAALIRLQGNQIASDHAINTYSLRLGMAPEDFRKRVAEASPPSSPSDSGVEPQKVRTLRTDWQPQDKVPLDLCHLALTNRGVLDLIRAHDFEPIFQFVPGTQALEQIWRSKDDLCDARAFSVFYNQLEPEEQSALSSILGNPGVAEPINDANHIIQILEFRRAQRELHQLKNQLASAKLTSEQMATLNHRYKELIVEVRDRRALLPPPVVPPIEGTDPRDARRKS